MKKRKSNYFIIFLFSLFITLILVGNNHLYGSKIDWINQHTTIPNLFRNLFYETKSLIPNYILNLGAGQNIFNYSYYGLMSPIILISYLLPFIKMEIFISVSSIILYLATGIILFEFLNANNISKKVSLLTALSFQVIAPITFQFHHHIMFVWYLPFLIMALFGVEEFINKKRSFLLIISVFLIILINYYYSVPSLITIVIYGIYKIISKEKNSFTNFIVECLKSSLRIIIPILMAGFILIPTAYCMFEMERNSNSIITIKDLLLPHIGEILYSSFGMGLSFLLLISPFSTFCKNKLKKEEIFLSLSLIILTFFPPIMYLLNGKLYIRGKVLIPILILYMISFVKFITDLSKDKIDIKKIRILILIILTILIISNFGSFLIVPLILDALTTYICLILFKKHKKLSLIYGPLILTLFISSIFNNFNEKYIEEDELKEEKIVEKLLNKVNDKSFYRTDNISDSNKNANRVYKDNFYTTSSYSSTYNSYYNDFYNNKISNNIEHRNILNLSGANNYLFNKIMGVKYIISPNKNNEIYHKIASSNNVTLYRNENANPIIYTTNKFGSEEEYNNLEYPYNIEYLVNRPVTKSKIKANYNSTVEKLNLDLKEEYKFALERDKKTTYKLPQTIKEKILIISFDMNYNQSCKFGDTFIKINGIQNKLTCKEWMYHNKNNTFKYVITNKKELKELKIYLSEGTYDISNINIYTMDYPKEKYKELSNIKINKKGSIIEGTIDNNEESYLITSLPYDKGFEIYLDNKKEKTEIVNTSFLGTKLPKGKHEIKIKYTSPGYKQGVIISIIGVISMLILLITERKIKQQSRTK